MFFCSRRQNYRNDLQGCVIQGLQSCRGFESPNLSVLIAARAVQGVGAAILAPNCLALLNHAYAQPDQRGRAVGFWAAGASVIGNWTCRAKPRPVVGLLVNIAFYGLIFVLSLYFQKQHGFSPLQTGLAFVPMMAVVLPFNILGPRMSERFGTAAVIALGAAIAAAGLLAVSAAIAIAGREGRPHTAIKDTRVVFCRGICNGRNEHTRHLEPVIRER
jgi:MFS family permease